MRTTEWVEIVDSTSATIYRFDVSWLVSGWECIYGRGCQGVRTAPAAELAEGCCSYGAHLRDDAERASVEEWANKIPAELWQYGARGRKAGVVVRAGGGQWRTRVIDGACVFLNRPGSAQGQGCALHSWALRDAVSPVGRKPVVCWQLPVRLDYSDDPRGDVVTVGAWTRAHWGAGGADFAWWCTEAPEAYEAATPLYLRAATELKTLLPAKVWRDLREYLDRRLATSQPAPYPVAQPRQRPKRKRQRATD